MSNRTLKISHTPHTDHQERGHIKVYLHDSFTSRILFDQLSRVDAPLSYLKILPQGHTQGHTLPILIDHFSLT